MSTDRNAVLLFGEEMPTCPECGRRLMVSEAPVREDQDGPIHAGICPEHGAWLVQDAPEDEDEEDEDEDDD